MPGFWTCCTCLHGLHQIDVHTECLQCGEARCPNCPIDSRDADMSLHSCHEISPYPATTAHSVCSHSLEVVRHMPPITESRSSILQPLPVFDDVRRPRLQELAGHPLQNFQMQTRGNLYFCCRCGDGPKVYENQPKCINCEHVVCSNCVPVK
ncbi:uncharacterized protein BP01DRAFT_116753 [Aspergillus saccharolyticus JOP 1030-1]|uniref:Uncharacterized protein n=1 Tax=Aspergillus saccharolyticus JOP 1030-1 TaxID=1450539 RepID=A0A318ZXA3_9EURO|nr:hypothetical protein BP01DRAFT_116753 [Aspergillus saccharolyticus JOP 1030-1]PYH48943.1 hypothetical protein BP01DRAFT_116753 [Aspergillus saccharolyticus JOP 1030-1]